ncbi:glycine--tRNA ligase subunit beta [Oceanidesulfovibrio marinus]|uniref:Glycine--tRNA ligase beta subunit n=1 Tax=Oceanidesulfovibrio marinus TaxID=370038 RepID=A0A6M4X901_9BACT|nr:glycine--tRNA ligase subunit beta [Oceanidesulfovibrio marinus]QJT08185.1 glycine--tRNA ligase subunit beta [Oceanidesulfovibrio marinus]TVM35080.1 glycine--tRNA ligase subunit beta [Oceanidesulfovibrio marinus]
MSRLVFEIGFEEMPARFLSSLVHEGKEIMKAKLTEIGLGFGTVHADATPRRLAIRVEDLDAVQEEREELVTGPPAAVAFKDGEPTKAAIGFARGQGMSVEDLTTVTTDKGEYLALTKRTGGVAAMELLPPVLEACITGLTFPKKMHWGSGEFTFGRPLRWLLALLDEDVVPLSIAGLESGRKTWGHRVHGPGPFELKGAFDYEKLIHEKCRVTLSASMRRELIMEHGEAAALAVGGQVVWNHSLLEEVGGLAEMPVPIVGDFDPSFLELPKEVLLTSMESHQKSFGVQNSDGELLPHFLATLNLNPTNEELVKKGWERVLKARLEDARFFWKTDLAAEQSDWLDKLEHVVFLGPLGSMGDKSRRIEALCGWLAEHLEPSQENDARRAGRICKTDLVSEMVGEFAELQGVMGAIYADKQGENAIVSTAVGEQYLPAGPDSPLPEATCGAILSMADKADTLMGCFGLGRIPTGANDPFALRRGVLGICRILVDRDWRVDLRDFLTQALDGYGDITWKLPREEALDKALEFFREREKNWFASQDFPTLMVEAALQAGYTDVPGARARLAALKEFSSEPGFENAVLTFKRAANIIRKQAESMELSGKFDPDKLEEEAEKNLAMTLGRMSPKFDVMWEKEDYQGLMALMLEIRPAVDAFFDNVMVMCEDEALKRNRLELLQALVSRLGRIADFNALQM